eukprot:scaffold54919_cov48-Phaeocystis_antarctica.AAC.1
MVGQRGPRPEVARQHSLRGGGAAAQPSVKSQHARITGAARGQKRRGGVVQGQLGGAAAGRQARPAPEAARRRRRRATHSKHAPAQGRRGWWLVGAARGQRRRSGQPSTP